MCKDIWETNNGRLLEVCKMETSHISNCINFLQRKLDKGEGTREYIVSDPFGSDFYEAEEDISDLLIEWIEIFNNELQRRKILIK